ncbi:MAG: WG repeat-containing protein [Rikenellaceae bacterium]
MRAIFIYLLLSTISITALSQVKTDNGSSKWDYSIKCAFGNIEQSVNGLSRASDTHNLWGFINSRGEWVIKPIFKSCTNFDKNNLSKVCIAIKGVGLRYGFINRNGTFVIPARYPSMTSFNGGYAVAQDRNGLFGLLDMKGNWVIKPMFEALTPFQNGLAKATKGDKVGFIDLSGEWIVPPIFEQAKFQDKNSVIVKKNGLWGVVRFTRTYK